MQKNGIFLAGKQADKAVRHGCCSRCTLSAVRTVINYFVARLFGGWAIFNDLGDHILVGNGLVLPHCLTHFVVVAQRIFVGVIVSQWLCLALFDA